ncbi:hypothetical protein Tco_0575972 [Tanacetum coccineum]
MMKYSFDDDEDYITIKEFEYLNHSKDSLDAYQELLHLIDEGWVVTTPEPYGELAKTIIWKWISSKKTENQAKCKLRMAMEKTVKIQGHSPKSQSQVCQSDESTVKTEEPDLKNTIGCNLKPYSDGRGSSNSKL